MGEIDGLKLETAESFRVLGDSFSAHPSPEILTKHNIKETDGKGNIWGPFYIPKVEDSGVG